MPLASPNALLFPVSGSVTGGVSKQCIPVCHRPRLVQVLQLANIIAGIGSLYGLTVLSCDDPGTIIAITPTKITA
jgi:hypothetical protein